jgi:cyclin A
MKMSGHTSKYEQTALRPKAINKNIPSALPSKDALRKPLIPRLQNLGTVQQKKESAIQVRETFEVYNDEEEVPPENVGNKIEKAQKAENKENDNLLVDCSNSLDQSSSTMSLCTSSYSYELNSTASSVDYSIVQERIVITTPDKQSNGSSTPRRKSPTPKEATIADFSPSSPKKHCHDSSTTDSVDAEETRDSPSEYHTACDESVVSQGRPCFLRIDRVFSEDIYAYCRKREMDIMPRKDYMTKQHEVTHEMRSVLVDWFCDVISEYNQHMSTFFLAVSLVDRSLTVVQCPRDKLQLLGATAIFVAAKFEEISPPELSDIVFVTEDTYTAEHIKKMEQMVLGYVNFDLSVPTVEFFGEFFAHSMDVSKEVRSLMWYLLELSAMEYACMYYRPSVLAAAALALAVGSLSTAECWPEAMRELSGIQPDELTPVIAVLRELPQKASTSNLQAIYLKYSEEEHHAVALRSMSVEDRILRD